MKSGNNGRVPTFANLKDQEKGTRTASIDGRDYEGNYMELPTMNVPVDQVVIRIEIRDTGIGIKKKDVHDAKLFSPYVQVSPDGIFSQATRLKIFSVPSLD
jgi:signal transduction histidine kinase